MLTLGEIKGVGKVTLKKLEELDIKSVFELFSFLPSRYIDLSEPTSISDATEGQLALFEGQVEKISSVSPRGKRAFSVMFSDLRARGRIRFKATFYNLPYLHDGFEAGQKYRLLAKPTLNRDMFEVVNPQMERADRLQKLSAGVYTLYPLRGTMGQNAFKNILYSALDSVKDATYGGRMGGVNEDIARCFEKLHRPDSIDCARAALAELASIDLGIVLAIYKKLSKSTNIPRKVFYKTENFRILYFKNSLPFAPTSTQQAAMGDILTSLSSNDYMARIISGDVGSGKTIVAFFALYIAAASGHQAALMVPTEILAKQHARAFASIADKLGITFAVLTSSTPQKERDNILIGLRGGSISCVIGTQSLIGEAVQYANLTLAVIDEQHKFGVGERKALENKGATDILSMTATPIPRSMALTFYEDIDISYIKKREEAASNVKTTVIKDVAEGVERIISACKEGKQAFIVCPAIVDAEGYDLASVESFAREYSAAFSGIKTAVLHGKLSSEQKAEAMKEFAEGRVQVLIATTVVEVGVDTLATEILILNADRFGLASLHQLRGRVGRDGSPANCYLQSGATGDKALERLSALENSNDGQYLAEIDFEMRGGGDFVGTKQSGVQLTPIFGLRMNTHVLMLAKKYESEALGELSLAELVALTRRGESRVNEFIDNLKKVTLNS